MHIFYEVIRLKIGYTEVTKKLVLTSGIVSREYYNLRPSFGHQLIH